MKGICRQFFLSPRIQQKIVHIRCRLSVRRIIAHTDRRRIMVDEDIPQTFFFSFQKRLVFIFLIVSYDFLFPGRRIVQQTDRRIGHVYVVRIKRAQVLMRACFFQLRRLELLLPKQFPQAAVFYRHVPAVLQQYRARDRYRHDLFAVFPQAVLCKSRNGFDRIFGDRTLARIAPLFPPRFPAVLFKHLIGFRG